MCCKKPLRPRKGHGKCSIFLVALTTFGKPRKMFHFPSCAHYVRQTTKKHSRFLCLARFRFGGSEKFCGISGTSSLPLGGPLFFSLPHPGEFFFLSLRFFFTSKLSPTSSP